MIRGEVVERPRGLGLTVDHRAPRSSPWAESPLTRRWPVAARGSRAGVVEARCSRRATVLLIGAVMLGLVTGCGTAADPGALSTGATPTTPPVEGDDLAPPVEVPPNGTVVSVLFERGRLARKSDQVEVERGSTVLLAVSTDVADEIHLHGYERVAPTNPGDRAVLEFTADRSGVYTAELERSGVRLLEVTVP
ncbi:hypothetical protein ACFPK1_00800 [Actinomycetospora rhizophila]|uniref:EfeO-type cupredoxin-like domain-containing protein n=1 Tax=Actinomycetospora rhizophila TaxID=1416876 RepID=A0ABV9Z8C8_9PSEU